MSPDRRILWPNGSRPGPTFHATEGQVAKAMPLDDREQRILAEIERQFYEDDPELARAVKNIDRSSRFGIRLPLVGLVAGLIVVVVFFTRQTVVALVGFGLMVASATALVQAIWMKGWGDSDGSEDAQDGPSSSRWPFGRG